MKWSGRAGLPGADQRRIADRCSSRTAGRPASSRLAVDALQRRAGDDAALARRRRRIQPGADRVQPGPAVLIGQRLAAAHLRDVAGGWKASASAKGAPSRRGEQAADGALAGAGDAHDQTRRAGSCAVPSAAPDGRRSPCAGPRAPCRRSGPRPGWRSGRRARPRAPGPRPPSRPPPARSSGPPRCRRHGRRSSSSSGSCASAWAVRSSSQEATTLPRRQASVMSARLRLSRWSSGRASLSAC